MWTKTTFFTIVLLVFSGYFQVVEGQEETRSHQLSQDLTVSDLEYLFEQSAQRSDDVFSLDLMGDMELNLVVQRTDHYPNGGTVKVYEVVNNAASEFLLARYGDNYFATFSRNHSQFRLCVEEGGSLKLMEDILEELHCGTDHMAIQMDTPPQRHERSTTQDSLNLLLAFSPNAEDRVKELVNIYDHTAIYVWANTAISYLNLTLENSGFEGICRLELVERVEYEPMDGIDAFIAMRNYSYDLEDLREKVENHCIHIRSFIFDHDPFYGGPLGVGELYREGLKSLYNSSVPNFIVFCHEVGHNFGFGHGPNADDSPGAFPFSRGFNTQHAGLDGPNVSTIMDYGPHIFWFSNLERPYDGEFEEHHDRFLGSESRDHIRTLNETFPHIKNINSSWEIIDTTICEGQSVYGYNSSGIYYDTFPEDESCSGLRIRELNLTVNPRSANDFGIAHTIESFFPDDSTFGIPSLNLRLFEDGVWAYNSNHIYWYNQEGSALEKIVSFPDPIKGPYDSGVPDFENQILGIFVLNDTVFVRSGSGSIFQYKADENEWEKNNWKALPDVNPITETLIYENGGEIYRSANQGLSWEVVDIPFEEKFSDYFLHMVFEGDRWIVYQRKSGAPSQQESVLWISEDDGLSWTSNEIDIRLDLSALIYADGVYYVKGNQNYYQSSDGGKNWEIDSLFSGSYMRVAFSEAMQLFFLLDNDRNNYILAKGDTLVDFLTSDFLNGVQLIHNHSLFIRESIIVDGSFISGFSVYDLSEVSFFREEVVICKGDNYQGFDEAGQYIVDVEGGDCYSSYLLDLVVVDTYKILIDTTICHNQTFEGIGESGTYLFFPDSQEHCDEATRVELTVLEPLDLVVEKSHDSGDGDGFISIEHINGGMKPYELNWSNDQSTDSIGDLSYGEYSLTITDSNGCSYEFSFQIEQVSQVEETDLDQPQSLSYPNPARDYAIIEWSGMAPEEISLYDMSGREVYSSRVQPGLPEYYLDLSGFSVGVYIV
ncbi:MAG: T9SS C-terminal target domain-containing protein, partial [Saprospirales bacterium]